MTIEETLRHARQVLADNNIEDAPLEAEVLLRHALQVSRVQLYLELDRQLDSAIAETFRHLIERRLAGEPTAYITGHREFYGLDFYVDCNVLIPRPESELLVEKALKLARNRPVITIADIGTGSGALAISLALNLPQARIYATDISPAALRVALFNCQQHNVENQVCLLAGDMLEPLPEPVDLIVANLPYVKEAELRKVNTLNFEPSLALNGGASGLEKIRPLFRQINNKLNPGGSVLIEIGQGQSEALVSLLETQFPSAGITVTADLAGIKRVVSLTLPMFAHAPLSS
ncbi:MAG: peptide chain release factor N(5)-glutamine methyltransferase [Chloroflexota bacterium]